MGFGVWGSGVRVQGAGFRVQGAGCRVRGQQSREDLVGRAETLGAEEEVAYRHRRTVHRKMWLQKRRTGTIEGQTELGEEGQGT